MNHKICVLISLMNKNSLLQNMVELCKKAQIDIRGKVSDTKPLLEASYRTRRNLAKSMGKTICSMADKRNIIQFDTLGLNELIDEIMKRIRTIDGIINLLTKVANREKHVVVDIRRYFSHSSGDKDEQMNEDEDSTIIEEYGN